MPDSNLYLCYNLHIHGYTVKLLSSNKTFKYNIFSVYYCFPPSLPIALSVVSMDFLSPHKMALIRLSTWQQGRAGSENRTVTQRRGCGGQLGLRCLQLAP